MSVSTANAHPIGPSGPRPGAVISTSHPVKRPTTIQGWNDASRRVMPGTHLSDRILIRSGGRTAPRTVALLRARIGSSEWKVVARNRTSAAGHMTVRFTAPNSGAWKLRIWVQPSRLAREVRSASRRIVVRTPQPKTTQPATPDAPPPSAATAESVVHVTGDIGQCGGAADKTAALIDASAGVLIATGDLAYPNGTTTDFATCYDPFYGPFKDVTFPVPGNHEYNSAASAYFSYFGDRVGTAEQPWYSVDIGAWRFYMLNSNCDLVGGCDVGSKQYTWLMAQLSGVQPRCSAAVWHHPRWSSGAHGPDPSTAALYELLLTHGADMLLTGHEHNYERFARLDSSGRPSPSGIREFVVGTGGASLRSIPGSAPGSEVRLNDSHGVLMLTLGASDVRWRFVPTEPAGATDAGTEGCH